MKVSSSTKLIQHLPRNGTQLVGCAVRQICEIPLLQPWFVGDRLSMTLQSWIVFGMQLFKFHSRLGYTSTMLVHMHIYIYVYIYTYIFVSLFFHELCFPNTSNTSTNRQIRHTTREGRPYPTIEQPSVCGYSRFHHSYRGISQLMEVKIPWL